MNIYLAGDSIVQDYTNEEFIAGWGQFLPYFIKSENHVINFAKGGRSSRLFINEGRFEEIEKRISKGDYLFIDFCHNDDASKDYKSMFNRLVELGKPDDNGRYPVIPGERVSTDYIPPEYIAALMKDTSIQDKEAVINSVKAALNAYPYDSYYPYSKDASKGSYKWFIKQYIDLAREHMAVPVLVTAPARTYFNNDGTIMDNKGLHGGDNFSYIRAMKQIGEETHTPVIDLFSYSVQLFEKIGHTNINKYMAVKKGITKGLWPDNFNKALNNPATVFEKTHFNKYGAWLLTKGLVSLIEGNGNPELTYLKNILTTPGYSIAEPMLNLEIL